MADCRILVLGGSSGIGLAFAQLAATEPGASVAVTAPSERDAATAQDWLGSQVGVHIVDFLVTAQQDLVDLAAETDVLVLSAGLEYVGPIQFEPAGAFEQMLAVNVAGPAMAARACIPGMIERGCGLIVGLGSIVTDGPRPFLAGYSASKAAFETYIGSLSQELRGTGVRVEILRLGPVATRLGSNGPANWEPDPASPFHQSFLEARSAAERERGELLRAPLDVAQEMLDVVRSFRA